MKPLVALLTSESYLAQEQAASAVAPLVERLDGDMMHGTTAWALRNLAEGSPENQAAITQAGAIGPLVKLLEDGMPGVREEAAGALWNLAMSDVDNQMAIARSNAAIPLAALLKGDAQEQATITLLSLAVEG